MSTVVLNSSTVHAASARNDAAVNSARNASSARTDAKASDGKASGDVVQLSGEARLASSSNSAAYSFSPVRIFDLPNGMRATLGTALNENGETVAQLSYTDKSGADHAIFLSRSSTLRILENGEIEIIPYQKSTETKGPFAGPAITTASVWTSVEKSTRQLQGSDADEVFILLPSNSTHVKWDVDAGDGDNVVIDLSGEEVAIRTGSGNDTIIGIGGMYTVDAGAGDDTVELVGEMVSKVDGGDGNDTISVKSSKISAISGGNGDDSIKLTGDVTGVISGGAGSDGIVIHGNAIEARIYGDGPDVQDAGDDAIAVHGDILWSEVHTGDGKNRVHVQGAVYSDITGGSDDDAITVGSAHKAEIDGGDGDDTLKVDSLSQSVVMGGGGNNDIHVGSATGSEIYGGGRKRSSDEQEAGKKEAGISRFASRAHTVGVSPGSPENAGDGNNTITVGGAFGSAIYGGSGDDSITVANAREARIDGGDGDDTIAVDRIANSEITAGRGNTTITISRVMDSRIDGSAPASSLKSKGQEDAEAERKRSEFEQEVADAAMGIRKGSAAAGDDDAAASEEEAVAPDREEHASESASLENTEPRATFRYSGRYGSGAGNRGRARFSVTI